MASVDIVPEHIRRVGVLGEIDDRARRRSAPLRVKRSAQVAEVRLEQVALARPEGHNLWRHRER